MAKRDIPGLSRRQWSRATVAARIFLALALLTGISYWFFTVAGSGVFSVAGSAIYALPATETRNDLLAQSCSPAVRTVTEIYGRILAGGPLDDLEQMLAPGAKDALSQLTERHRAGKLDRYSILYVDLAADCASLAPPGSQPTVEVILVVAVEEYPRASAIPTLYECRLKETRQKIGPNGASSDAFRLESIRLVPQTASQ